MTPVTPQPPPQSTPPPAAAPNSPGATFIPNPANARAHDNPLFMAFGTHAEGKNFLRLNATEAHNLIEDTPAAGNCFFNAASRTLTGQWDHNGYMRAKIADEIASHPARYANPRQLTPPQLAQIGLPANHISTLDDVVRYTRTPGCWALGLHQEALQRCFPDVHFSIWQPLPKPLNPLELSISDPTRLSPDIPTSVNVWQRHTLAAIRPVQSPQREVHIRYTEHGAPPHRRITLETSRPFFIHLTLPGLSHSMSSVNLYRHTVRVYTLHPPALARAPAARAPTQRP